MIKFKDFLKKQQLGFATFLPLNTIKPRLIPNNIKELESRRGVYGLATKLVDYDSIFDHIFSYVFGSTLIVEDINVARELGIGRVRMVTLEGDILETSGSMKGGFRTKRRGVVSFAGSGKDFSEHTIDQYEDELVENRVEIEKLEIAKLDLKDGDILAVIVREDMSDSSMASLQHKLDETFKPLGVKGVVFCGDFELKGHREDTLARLKATQEFLQQEAAKGNDVEMPRRVLRSLELLNRTPFDEITTNQLMGLKAEMELLAELGRTKFRTIESIWEIQKGKMAKV